MGESYGKRYIVNIIFNRNVGQRYLARYLADGRESIEDRSIGCQKYLRTKTEIFPIEFTREYSKL